MGKIELTPAELLAQSNELNSLAQRYEALFSNVSSVLNNVNTGWSDFLSNNFEGKINSAQKSFSGIVSALTQGAEVAGTSANSFESVDSLLAKGMFAGAASTAETVMDVMYRNEKSDEDKYTGFWAELQKKYESGQDVSEFIKQYYDKIPDEIKEELGIEDVEFLFNIMNQDFDDWMNLDVDPKLVEKIANLCGQDGLYGKGIAKVYDMVMNPENAGKFGELYSGQQWMQEEAARLLANGDYAEGLKMAAESAGIGIFTICYGSFEALTELGADFAEGIVNPVIEKMDFVADIIPGDFDNKIVDGGKAIVEFGCNMIRKLF